MAWSISSNPIDYQPPQPQPAPQPKSVGPTGFWQRIAQVGIGKVNALNAYRTLVEHKGAVDSNNSIVKNAARDTGHAGSAVGRFLFSNTARFANQAYQEGRQAGDTAEMLTANATHNPEAFAAANARSQRNYKGFNKKGGGILNVGTFSSEKAAKQGSWKQGAKDIGGGTLATASELVPMGKLTKAGKVYKLARGAEEGDKALSAGERAVRAGKDVAKQAAVGAGAGSAGTAGSELVQNGKVNAKDVFMGGVKGAIIGGGLTGGIHLLHGATGSLKTALTRGPKAALADLKGSKGNVQSDVMTNDQANHVAQHGTMDANPRVTDQSSGATKINVRQPKLLQKGAIGKLEAGGKDMNQSTKTITTPKTIPMSDEEYIKRSNDIAASHDKQTQEVMKSMEKQPAIDGYHTTQQLAQDHADMMRNMDAGAKGGQMQKTADGGYVRTSDHTPFYRDYYAEHGRAPSKAAYLEQAYKELQSGKAPYGMSDAYKQLADRETQAVQKITEAHNALHEQLDHEYTNGKPNPDYKPPQKVETGFVMGKKAAASATPAAQKAQRRISQIDTIIQKAQKQGTTKSADQMRALLKEKRDLQDVASGKTTPVEKKPSAQAAKLKAAARTAAKTSVKRTATAHAQAATVEAPRKSASIEVKVKRPTSAAPIKEKPPITESARNGKPSKGIGAKLQSRGAGTFNPELGAARQGHVDYAKELRRTSSGDIKANYDANQAANKFEKLYKDYIAGGGTKEQFIKDIESGNTPSAAHKFWVEHYQQLGNKALDAGVLNAKRDSTYFARNAQFKNGKNPNSMGGLKKSGGFAKGRAQLTTDEFGNGGDLYKTHAEFKAAVEKQGGKVLDDPVQLMKQTTAARLKAINHAEALQRLENTKMGDGREATITYNQKEGLPPGYRDYNTTLLPGRAVHPDAVKGIEALTKVSSLDQYSAEHAISKFNSISKRLVTLNGLVHGKNFVLASIREQGLRGTATAFRQFSEADVNRAIEHGFAPSRAGMTNVFDEATNGTNKLGNAVTKALGGARNKMDKALFEGFGDKLGMHTYLNIEKQLIKRGLSQDEAGKIAADTANRVLFSGRATSTSAALRETSRLAFFAGKFFQSTMQIATKSLGLAKDNTLSAAAQKAEQRMAARSAARGFAYLFTAAQAINYATTGHSTFQNKDSKISPVFFVDKTTGKEYHITNWYGQLGELLNITNPKTVINKLSPGAQELIRLGSNTDPYTQQQIRDKNASGLHQDAQVLANILENMATPLGFQLTGVDKLVGKGADPAEVSAAKLLGYGASPKDQTRMEKTIDQKFYASLPQGQSSDKSLAVTEAKARQDIRNGNPNSANVQQVKSKMSTAAFNKFLKSGAASDTQRHFDSLSTADKIAIVQQYSPKDLQELNLDSLVKTLTTSKQAVQTLHAKGVSDQQIQAAMQKAGYNSNQIRAIYTNAKRASSQASRTARRQPRWKSPLL